MVAATLEPLIATPNEHPTKINRVRDKVSGNLVVARKPLPADYGFSAHNKVISIEVKWSISDLLDSFRVEGENSGPRLAVELRKMVAYSDIPWLIIPQVNCRGDGLVYRDDGQVSGWQYNSVKGILTDVALYGVIVDEWAGDIAARIAQLYYVIGQEEHSWIKQRGRPEFISLNKTYHAAVWSLCAIDMVGPITAEALLATFGSVEGVSRRTIKELSGVAGVGPKVAQSIVKTLQGNWSGSH